MRMGFGWGDGLVRKRRVVLVKGMFVCHRHCLSRLECHSGVLMDLRLIKDWCKRHYKYQPDWLHVRWCGVQPRLCLEQTRHAEAAMEGCSMIPI